MQKGNMFSARPEPHKYLAYRRVIDRILDSHITSQIFREVVALVRLTKPGKANRKREYRNFFVMETDPLIILTMESTVDLELFSEIIGPRKAYLFKLFPWTKETIAGMRAEGIIYKKHQRKYPQHTIVFLCNTEREVRLAKYFQVPAIWCNHNCFLDENTYKPQAGKNKKYDVVYNARFDPIKRHYLLTAVDNIGLILGPNVNNSLQIKEYKHIIKSLIPNAIVTNDEELRRLKECEDEDFAFPLLSSANVVSVLNDSRVGVILSREEGACYASAEYLLCGLPVVSTRNAGGRDVFLEGQSAKYVSPSPSAVRTAINELIHSDIDPSSIRQKTLSKMEEHRDRFRCLLQDIYDKESCKYNVKEQWKDLFINKMMIFGQKWPEALLAALNQ